MEVLPVFFSFDDRTNSSAIPCDLDNLCSANSAFKGPVFEPDQLDTFYLIWPDLGKINSLNLLIQSEGANPPWFCEYITVEDSQTSEKYKYDIIQMILNR